ncbi:MAG: hypothetical protein SVZ03_13140 [Spirochaetota bacterium]|nr:hypothetical protein [Spirochaetota bacterium]
MNDRFNIFERALDKLKLRQSIPQDVKEYILDNRARALLETLRAVGEYNLVYDLVLRIYFLSGKLGLTISVVQSKIVLGIISLLLGASLSTGVVIVADFLKETKSEFLDNKEVIELYKDNIMPEKSIIKKLNEKWKQPRESVGIKKRNAQTFERLKGKKPIAINARLGINRFEASGVDKRIASDITDKLYQKLRLLKGRNLVVYKRIEGIEKSVNRQLVGRVSRLRDSYILAVRVVDGESGKQLFGKTINYKQVDNLDSKLEQIAEQIISVSDIWNRSE